MAALVTDYSIDALPRKYKGLKMTTTKSRLGLVISLGCSLLSSACTASEAEVELYQSCINRKGERFAIPFSRAKQLPVWKSVSQSEPPLSVKSAVLKAAKEANVPPEKLFMLQLNQVANTEIWYYIVTFLSVQSREYGSSSKHVTLLMDGSRVIPQTTECR